MNNSPFFSIVIPTYNRARFIDEAIASVLSQNFNDFELIIVDDGSTDTTSEVVESFHDNRIIYIKKINEERAVARNTGARKAQGAYVNFLDSDDCLYSHHLSVAYEFLKKEASAEIFHLAYDVKDASGKFLRNMQRISNINKQIINGNVLSCNGVFIRKDVLLKHAFNEDRSLSSLEDWELWIRMSARFRFFHVNEITSTIILHDERSVVTGNAEKVKLKVNLFNRYVSEDSTNQRVYSGLLKKTHSSAFMYLALHLAMIGSNSKEVILHLCKGIKNNFGAIFTKRFLVIMRFLVRQ